MRSIVRLTKERFEFFKESILKIEKASFPSPWPARSFVREIDNPVSSLYALVVREEVAGYICFWEYAGETHLMNIAVRPGLRGRGYGKALLKFMLDRCTEKTVRTAWLEVRPSNFTAISLYDKAGFKEVARRKGYYSDTGEDAIIMALSLFEDGENVVNLDKTDHANQFV